MCLWSAGVPYGIRGLTVQIDVGLGKGSGQRPGFGGRTELAAQVAGQQAVGGHEGRLSTVKNEAQRRLAEERCSPIGPMEPLGGRLIAVQREKRGDDLGHQSQAVLLHPREGGWQNSPLGTPQGLDAKAQQPGLLRWGQAEGHQQPKDERQGG